MDFKTTSVLVTGGAGFIGSHLVDELLERGAKVRVLDNLATGHRRNLAHCIERIEFIEGDIRDLATCRTACEGVELVYHQAALGSVPRSMDDPAASLAVNVGGTTNMFAAARDAKVARVVYASSSAVYGDSETLPKREGQEGKPLSPYALSKWINEELADTFARCYQMSFAGLRYFNVYGPRQDPKGPYAAVIPRFFDACLAGKAPTIFGDGEQSRDFTFVKDVVMANLRASRCDLQGARAFNIGAGNNPTTVKILAETICSIMDSPVAPVYQEARAGDVKHSQADISRAQDTMGYAPETALADGLSATKPA